MLDPVLVPRALLVLNQAPLQLVVVVMATTVRRADIHLIGTVSQMNWIGSGGESKMVYLEDVTTTLRLVILENARVLTLELVTALVEQSLVSIRPTGNMAAEVSLQCVLPLALQGHEKVRMPELQPQAPQVSHLRGPRAVTNNRTARSPSPGTHAPGPYCEGTRPGPPRRPGPAFPPRLPTR